MAGSRCGKELKQAFEAVCKGFSPVSQGARAKSPHGGILEKPRSSDCPDSGAFWNIFHYFRNQRWKHCSTLYKRDISSAESYVFKQILGKGESSSGRSFIASFGVQGRRAIGNNFGSFGARNAGQGWRFYHVDRYNVQHFRARGPRRWFENPQKVVIIVILGSGLVLTIYFSNLETVPYTHRKHFVLVSRETEKQLGESQFQQLKKTLKPKILPAIHPESVRVRLIARDIIQALERGLVMEQSSIDVEYNDDRDVGVDISTSQDLWSVAQEKPYTQSQWYGKDEVLDDKWVEKSRKSGKQSGEIVSTRHLDGLNWEILVVDDPIVNAFCLPGGKIMVFTGLLNVFRSNAEIATVISHEVAHAVARHASEAMTTNLWFAILQLILLQLIGMPDVVHAMSNLLLKLPFSRRMEMEADYIGLLLMASAGYDPCIAPSVYEKLGQLAGDSVIKSYLSTHPSGKKRGEMLRQAKVMEEALRLYRERISGHGIEGFL